MRVRCVGAVVLDEHHRLLLIRRGHAPAAGRWSVPGGRVDPDESTAEAVRRELLEETGLHGEVGRLLGVVEVPGEEGTVYVVEDYRCEVAPDPQPTPGDDATDARFVTLTELVDLNREDGLVDGLIASLARWDALPR